MHGFALYSIAQSVIGPLHIGALLPSSVAYRKHGRDVDEFGQTSGLTPSVHVLLVLPCMCEWYVSKSIERGYACLHDLPAVKPRTSVSCVWSCAVSKSASWPVSL
jgi:hypothetical protein